MSKTFFTLGYESHTLKSFLHLLNKHRIQILIDVRQRPISRKPGFSKRSLNLTLSQAGISYLHYPDLGTPPHLRKFYIQTGKVETTLRKYEKYLKSNVNLLNSLVEFLSTKRLCLLCLEKDHNACHRSVIAKKLTEVATCQPVHLP